MIQIVCPYILLIKMIFFLQWEYIYFYYSLTTSCNLYFNNYFIILLFICSSFRCEYFPGGSDGKEPACNAGDLSSIPGLGRSPEGGHGNLLQYSCLESPHGQRSLAGCSPWGCKALDTTERLNTAQHVCV